MVKKNQEIKLIYEKMKIQTLTLSKGQAQYKDRVQEIQILKIKITNLKRDQIIFSRSVKNMSVLKKNIFNLSKELNAEKTKVLSFLFLNFQFFIIMFLGWVLK